MTRMVVPEGVDYRRAVSGLVGALKPLGLGCYSLGHAQGDAQLVVGGLGKEVTLTPEQKQQLLDVLPSGVTLE